LPGSTTLCGAGAVACATWADFFTDMFPISLKDGLSLPQREWLFDSFVNRSYSDPQSALVMSVPGSLILYLDVAAEGANGDPSVFVPQLSNALVHEIGHNLGAIHLRDYAH